MNCFRSSLLAATGKTDIILHPGQGAATLAPVVNISVYSESSSVDVHVLASALGDMDKTGRIAALLLMTDRCCL